MNAELRSINRVPSDAWDECDKIRSNSLVRQNGEPDRAYLQWTRLQLPNCKPTLILISRLLEIQVSLPSSCILIYIFPRITCNKQSTIRSKKIENKVIYFGTMNSEVDRWDADFTLTELDNGFAEFNQNPVRQCADMEIDFFMI